MNPVFNQWIGAASVAASLMLATTPAHAVYTIVMTEAGGDVVATGSGSIDLSGVLVDRRIHGTCEPVGALDPGAPLFCTGSTATEMMFYFNTAPRPFGPESQTLASSSSGPSLFVGRSGIFLPGEYVSGSVFNTTTTWSGTTLAAMGAAPGSYPWTWGSGANADSIVLQIIASPSSQDPVTPPPIPGRVSLPFVPGVEQHASVLDLASGSGPSMTSCLLSTVKEVLGSDATYLGQSPHGAARISLGAQTIHFYPLEASTSTARGTGAFLTNSNALELGTSCGTFKVVPAVASLDDLGSALTAMGLSADLDAKGVLTAQVNGSLYAIRPDYFVTQGTATGTPSLAFDAAGVLRLTDRAGQVQILHAAFLDPAALQAAMGTALGGVLAVQTDGRGVFKRINGSELLLTPEMALSPAAGGLNAPNWLNDRADHFLYRVGTYHQGLAAAGR